MTDNIDVNTIREIVRQVVSEFLSSGGSASQVARGQSPSSTQAAQPLSPPTVGGAYRSPQQAGQATTPARVVIAADDVTRLADGKHYIEVPRGAIITPLAQDLISQRRLTVRWINPANTQPAADDAAPQVVLAKHLGRASVLIGLTYDQKSVPVQQVIASLVRETLPVALLEDDREGVTPAHRLRQLVSDINAGSLTAGIVLAEHGEFALCYANKFKNIRAYAEKGFYQLLQAVRNYCRLIANRQTPGRLQGIIDAL